MDKEILRGVLQRPIAFHPALARALGSINSAVFIGQLLFWTGKQQDPDGWIYKTQTEIEGETTLTRYEQESARKVAISLGILTEERRGIPAKMYYRINIEAVYALLNEKLSAIKNGENSHTGMGKTINHSIDIDYSKTTSSVAIAPQGLSPKKEKKRTPITRAECQDVIMKYRDSSDDMTSMIAEYLHRRKFTCDTKEGLREAFNRHRRTAKLLLAFSVKEVINAMDIAQAKMPSEWTLETAYKVLTK